MNPVTNMKHIFALSTAVFFLSGCGGGGSTSSETATQSSSESHLNGSNSSSLAEGVLQETPVTEPSSTNTSETLETSETSVSVTPEEIQIPNTVPEVTVPVSVTQENTDTTINIPTVPAAKQTAIQSGQVKDSHTGKGISNVKVSIGSVSTTTDENGFYTLSNLSPAEEAVVNFEKEGYDLGSTEVQLKALTDNNLSSAPNFVEYALHTHDKHWEYKSNEKVSGSHIKIDAAVAYVDSNNKPYSGTISAYLTILNITSEEGKKLFPGEFKGVNSDGETVQFASYGMINMVLKDSNGESVELAEGEKAVVGFDAVSLEEKPDILPLWYYDYEQGVWFEEGYAELQDDGSYKGEVSHLGTWSVNKPLENDPGIYRARIVYADGTPAKNVRVQAIGKNWISRDLSTDEEGVFEINVVPESGFMLMAYDYKNKYGAKYSSTLPAVASGDVVETRM